MKSYNQTQTTTQTQTVTQTQTIIANKWKNYAMEQGKKIIYLVLKKKSFSQKISDKINKEIEKKLPLFALKIIDKLQKFQPKDPENFIKYLMLKGTMKILEKIMNDNFLSLSEEDKISAQKMFEEGYVDEKKDDDDKKNDKEEKKHKGDNDNFKRENNNGNQKKDELILYNNILI